MQHGNFVLICLVWGLF